MKLARLPRATRPLRARSTGVMAMLTFIGAALPQTERRLEYHTNSGPAGGSD